MKHLWKLLPILAALALVAGACGDDDESADSDGGDDGGGGSTAACTFGEVFTTDGRIPELDLTVVEDDGVFITYNVSVTMREEVYNENPEGFETIAESLLNDIDNDEAQELNGRVGAEGEDQAAVAEDYLEQEGLVVDGELAGDLEGIDLSGIDIRVGSKDFTEQLVLGELLVQTFEAAGANVTNQVNLGGTQVNREALLNDEIDAYAEYNGTGWTEHLGQEDPVSDGEELTQMVAEMDLEQNSIVWLGRSEFNNTYAFAVNQDYVDANGVPTLQDMADFVADNPDATVCMESEFPDRSDGLVLFEEATGFEIPDDQIQILDTNLIYTETAG